ncbi:MAG: hypothetical protein AAFO81_12145 [Pseudomonadota bacterium]
MSASESQLERMQILVPAEQKQRMRVHAKKLGISVSELYRRSADAFAVDESEEEIHHAALEALVEALEVGTKRAAKAVDRVEREVAATLDFYEARKQTRAARDQSGETTPAS